MSSDPPLANVSTPSHMVAKPLLDFSFLAFLMAAKDGSPPDMRTYRRTSTNIELGRRLQLSIASNPNIRGTLGSWRDRSGSDDSNTTPEDSQQDAVQVSEASMRTGEDTERTDATDLHNIQAVGPPVDDIEVPSHKYFTTDDTVPFARDEKENLAAFLAETDEDGAEPRTSTLSVTNNIVPLTLIDYRAWDGSYRIGRYVEDDLIVHPPDSDDEEEYESPDAVGDYANERPRSQVVEDDSGIAPNLRSVSVDGDETPKMGKADAREVAPSPRVAEDDGDMAANISLASVTSDSAPSLRIAQDDSDTAPNVPVAKDASDSAANLLIAENASDSVPNLGSDSNDGDFYTMGMKKPTKYVTTKTSSLRFIDHATWNGKLPAVSDDDKIPKPTEYAVTKTKPLRFIDHATWTGNIDSRSYVDDVLATDVSDSISGPETSAHDISNNRLRTNDHTDAPAASMQRQPSSLVTNFQFIRGRMCLDSAFPGHARCRDSYYRSPNSPQDEAQEVLKHRFDILHSGQKDGRSKNERKQQLQAADKAHDIPFHQPSPLKREYKVDDDEQVENTIPVEDELTDESDMYGFVNVEEVTSDDEPHESVDACLDELAVVDQDNMFGFVDVEDVTSVDEGWGELGTRLAGLRDGASTMNRRGSLFSEIVEEAEEVDGINVYDNEVAQVYDTLTTQEESSLVDDLIEEAEQVEETEVGGIDDRQAETTICASEKSGPSDQDVDNIAGATIVSPASPACIAIQSAEADAVQDLVKVTRPAEDLEQEVQRGDANLVNGPHTNVTEDSATIQCDQSFAYGRRSLGLSRSTDEDTMNTLQTITMLDGEENDSSVAESKSILSDEFSEEAEVADADAEMPEGLIDDSSASECESSVFNELPEEVDVADAEMQGAEAQDFGVEIDKAQDVKIQCALSQNKNVEGNEEQKDEEQLTDPSSVLEESSLSDEDVEDMAEHNIAAPSFVQEAIEAFSACAIPSINEYATSSTLELASSLTTSRSDISSGNSGSSSHEKVTTDLSETPPSTPSSNILATLEISESLKDEQLTEDTLEHDSKYYISVISPPEIHGNSSPIVTAEEKEAWRVALPEQYRHEPVTELAPAGNPAPIETDQVANAIEPHDGSVCQFNEERETQKDGEPTKGPQGIAKRNPIRILDSLSSSSRRNGGLIDKAKRKAKRNCNAVFRTASVVVKNGAIKVVGKLAKKAISTVKQVGKVAKCAYRKVTAL